MCKKLSGKRLSYANLSGEDGGQESKGGSGGWGGGLGEGGGSGLLQFETVTIGVCNLGVGST